MTKPRSCKLPSIGTGTTSGRSNERAPLPAGDLEQVIQLAEGLVSINEFGQLQPALGRLALLVGSDTATLTQLDLSTQREVAIRWPDWSGEATRWQAYARLVSTHPLRKLMAAQHPTQALPVATSDILSQRQWCEHPLRRQAMPEVTDQLSVLLARYGNAVHAITLGRQGGTFTARQHEILHRAKPFLASAVSLARRTSHQAVQICPSPMRWVPANSAPGVEHQTGSGGPGHLVGRELSTREREVLDLVAEGLTDAQVARRLGLAPATVSKHLRRIYARTGAPNRAAAVRLLLGQTAAVAISG